MADYKLTHSGEKINEAITRALNIKPFYVNVYVGANGIMSTGQTLSEVLLAISAGRSVFLHAELTEIDYPLSSVDAFHGILGFSGVRYDVDSGTIYMDSWTVSDAHGVTFNNQIVSQGGDG